MLIQDHSREKLKKDWLHACAVADSPVLPGLGNLILSCYYIEDMIIELQNEDSGNDLRYHSFYRAWICLFFEVLRSMYKSRDYQESAPPCVKSKMNELERMKATVGKARGYLAKLTETRRDKPIENEEELFRIEPKYDYSLCKWVFDEHGISYGEPAEIIINRNEVSREFISTLKDCEVSEYGKPWLSMNI